MASARVASTGKSVRSIGRLLRRVDVIPQDARALA
jgi:hypothetical protein